MKHDDHDPSDASLWAALALPGQVGLYIALGALLGVGAGHFIDQTFHTAPIATLIGLLLGLAIGILGVYRLITTLK